MDRPGAESAGSAETAVAGLFAARYPELVGAARVAYAMSRDTFGSRHIGATNRWGAPAAAIVVLGYTLYRNVYPYPSGDAYWFPVVGGAWLVAAIIGVLVAPGTARRLGAALAVREDINATVPEDVSR